MVSCSTLMGTSGVSGFGGGLPLTVAAQLELRALQGLGLLTEGRICRPRKVEQGQVSPTSVAHWARWVRRHNQASVWVTLAWAASAVGLVLWSLVSVAAVPRKEDSRASSSASGRAVTSLKRSCLVVDEDAAWAWGLRHWATLGWVDELVGTYGKSAAAVADDAEIVKEPCSSDYEPHKRFRRAWDEQIQRSGGIENASLVWALLSIIGRRGCASLVLAVLVEVGLSMVGMVVALDVLLHHLQAVHEAQQAGLQSDLLVPGLMIILLAFGVPMAHRMASTVVCLLDGHYTTLCAAGLASAVYEKALLLPASGVACGSTAQKEERSCADVAGVGPNVVQLLNIDIIEAWGHLLKTLVYTAVSPLAVLALLTLLAVHLRLVGVLGALYILPALMVTWLIQMLSLLSWRSYQKHQDVRLSCLTELIFHIRTIRSLAWEQLSCRLVGEAREQELHSSFACTATTGLAQANMHAVPWFSLILTLFFMELFDGGVQARHIFVLHRIMASLLLLLQTTALGLQKLVAAPSSLARLKTFLQQQERPRPIARRPPLDKVTPAVRLCGSFSFWPGGRAALQTVDLVIPRGELVALMGSVASGKSALLLTILGELFPCAQRPVIEVPRAVAFCAQEPWIFEGTLRENITLSQAFELDRYHHALQAASLFPDLQALPGGDQANIGSFGIRLSSSQRARVALARAAYTDSEAELVLLDDPFASLDEVTAEHIFNELLCGPALRGRTRVVVVHPHTSHLDSFDRVVLLEEGRIAVDGPPAEARASEAFRRLLRTAPGQKCPASSSSSTAVGQVVTAELSLQCPHSEYAAEPAAVAKTPTPPVAMTPPQLSCPTPPISSPPWTASPARDPEGHERFTWRTMRLCLHACGSWNLLVFVVLAAMQRLLLLAESFVLASWVDAKADGDVHDRSYLSALVLVVMACCCSFAMLYWAAAQVSFCASRDIHDKVFLSLLRAPVDRFFDRQPLGRLINRLSFDVRQLDNTIAHCVLMAAAFCCGFVFVQGYILSNVHRFAALAALPVYGVLLFYLYLYRGTTASLVSRSKLSLSAVQDLHSTAVGQCVSIRANGMRAEFLAKHNYYSASIMRCQYLIFYVVRAWIQSRVALTYSVLTALLALAGLWTHMSMGTLANIISLSFMALSEFETMSLAFCNFINVLNALQRLASFTELPQEAPALREGDPRIRFSLSVQRDELAVLEVKQGPLQVLVNGELPVLQASEDGKVLQLVGGRHLRNVAPGCRELLKAKESYDIVAVNHVSGSAEKMAEELCHPTSRVWLDLWHSSHARGLRLQLQDLTAGYCGEPSVLRGLNLDVPARGKVGLVGRTSCGKSTALLCIVRILEPRSGRVLIGGLDGLKLGLQTLRSIVGFVPQEPAIFKGSWRGNVDPLGELPEGRLWEALRAVGLLAHVKNLSRGLDADITSEGCSLSFGQKQLLSFARMVARQPPVLLLDECADGLDPRAQEAVRNSLLSEFPLSTILAVARNVETLLNLDHVVVLENGTAVDQGPARDLMASRRGLRAGLAKVAVDAH